MRNLMIRPKRYGMTDDFDNLFNGFFGPSCSSCYSPAVDIRETDDNIVLTFEVPGMEKDDIKVWVEDNVLTVSGERKSNSEEKDHNYIRSEIRSGSFSRSFRLSKNVDLNGMSADYKNGLLVVTVARAEEAKPKEIEIKVK